MSVHLTPAQARQLGLAPKRKKTTQRKEPRNGQVTICRVCRERFTTDAAEDRHVEETRHANYELELP